MYIHVHVYITCTRIYQQTCKHNICILGSSKHDNTINSSFSSSETPSAFKISVKIGDNLHNYIYMYMTVY